MKAPANSVGLQLLHLVSRGNAVVSELRRLAPAAPPDFRRPSKAQAALLVDFQYFKVQDSFEKQIDDNAELKELDEAIAETYSEIISRLYFAFESVFTYVTDLNRLLGEIEDGAFIQQSLELILMDTEGKQLLTESVYLYGVMLLVVEESFPGVLRERLLVAFYRYHSGRAGLGSELDEVCALMRGSGFVAGQRRPPDFPESLFRRIPVLASAVELILARVRSDDLYHQLGAWPLGAHRSRALGTQGGMAVLLLLAHPTALKDDAALMRELVDKFFPDNWVVNVYMGTLLNLADFWEPYKAARAALAAAAIQPARLKATATLHGQELRALEPQLERILCEGKLDADFFLCNLGKLNKLLRRSNVSLRWLLLHTTSRISPVSDVESKKAKSLREAVVKESGCGRKAILNLLLLTSQLELKLKEGLRETLRNRSERWDEAKATAVTQLGDLRLAFASDNPLMRIKKNQKLETWLGDMITKIEAVDMNADDTGSRLEAIIHALEEVGEFHSLSSNHGARQLLDSGKAEIVRLRRLLDLREDAIGQLAIITDTAYAWNLIQDFTPLMQESVKKHPSIAIKLRATFLKLSSGMDTPLMRIEQAGSPDLIAVSQFYSRHLVTYIRGLLQVIPATVFSLLGRMVTVESRELPQLPARLAKEELRSAAALDARYSMAALTHSISVLTEGLLGMGETRVGLIRLDSAQLLQDGIRRELVDRLSRLLHAAFPAAAAPTPAVLAASAEATGRDLAGFRRSFAYISDYINLPGLRIWQEELHRVLHFCLERETRVLSSPKGVAETAEESVFQSRVAPIPILPSTDPSQPTFLGRLIYQLRRITDPGSTVYVTSQFTWYDAKTKTERIGPNFIKTLDSLGAVGLSCLEELCGEVLKATLSSLFRLFRDVVRPSADWAALRPKLASSQAARKTFAAKLGKPAAVATQLLAKVAQYNRT